jgi:hypothetical protein
MKIKLRHAKHPMLVGFILILLSTSCVSQRPYPAIWPPLSAPQAKDCQSIVGTYNNWGEMVEYTGELSLTEDLFGFGIVRFAPTKVAFLLPDPNTLEVTVFGTNGEVFRRTLSTRDHDFVCEDGRAIIQYQFWGDADVAFFRAWTVVELTASDDYLVTKVKETDAGALMLMVPVVGTSTRWHRFKRLPDQSGA